MRYSFYAALLVTVALFGCAYRPPPSRPTAQKISEIDGHFTMPDKTALPYRAWLPSHAPSAVILALHGMNDSRDAFEYPGPIFAAAGMAVFSPDQRGFGASATRGRWPGIGPLTNDIRIMAGLLRERYPKTKLILMGESMGGAALMVAATQRPPPTADGYVLVAPAVWDRSEMNPFVRSALWLADKFFPGVTLTGGWIVKVVASDNRDALVRLSTDPLTIQATRVDAIEGLVDLMDRAAAAAHTFRVPSLFLYGGHDELVPPRATAATWAALPDSATLALYPNGYHLLLRDKDRFAPIEDIIRWIGDETTDLPSGAEQAAAIWMKEPSSDPAAKPLRVTPSVQHPLISGR